jgi:hypothetical protein
MAQAGYVTNAVRALITGASAGPSTNLVRAAHTKFVTALAEHPPRPIPVAVHAINLEDRADHLNTVLDALSVYLTAILQDTAQNVPGGLDLRQIDALLSDLAYNVTGTIRGTADAMAGRVR